MKNNDIGKPCAERLGTARRTSAEHGRPNRGKCVEPRSRSVHPLPAEARGLRLARFVKDDLRLCEVVIFLSGWEGVEITLRRAALSGRVEIEGEIENHFADIMSDPYTLIGTVALDAKSYRSLKNHWMRCRVDAHPPLFPEARA